MRVGCCGTAGRSLSVYSKYFNAIEIQSTFYKLPRKGTASRWRLSVPPDFAFTMKAFQGITHPADSPTWKRNRKAIEGVNPSAVGMLCNSEFVEKSWEETLSTARELKAEVIVVQLPPSFLYTNDNLERLLAMPYKSATLAVEFRHNSWLENLSRFIDKLKKKVIIVWDPLKHYKLEQKFNYYRLHGKDGFTNYRYVYSKEELEKLSSFCVRGKGFVFFNNYKMWENALTLKNIIKGL